MMEKWESVKLLRHAAHITEKIMFDEEGTQRSDEQIRFILETIERAVNCTLKTDFEVVFNILTQLNDGGDNSASRRK